MKTTSPFPALAALHPSPATRLRVCLRGGLAFVVFALCAHQPVAAREAPAVQQPGAHNPTAWQLSPKAEYMYYYLLFAEAMQTDNQPLMIEALQGRIRLHPTLANFQESTSILMSQENYPLAKEFASMGIRLFPDDQALTVLLAEIHSEMDNAKESITLLEKFLKKHPKSPLAAQELARLYINNEQMDKADRILNLLPTKDASLPTLLYRARILASTGKPKEARQLYTDILQKKADYLEGWIELAIFEEGQKNIDAAILAYKTAVAFTPNNLELWFRIVSLQLDVKKTSDAVATVNKAPAQGKFRMQVALLFADKGFTKEAETLLEQAKISGAEPDEVAFYLSLVRFHATRNPRYAAESLQSIAPSSPLFLRATLRKVQFFFEVEDYEHAREEAQKARIQSPELKELWEMESVALLKLNKIDEAQALLQQGLTLYPNNENLLFSLGHIQDESGDRAEALRTMEKVLATNPLHANALNYVGYSLAEQNKDLQRAHALITKALELNPNADYIVDSLAWVQYRMGKYQQAWENIRRCLDMGADDAVIWDHYGDIARALKKNAEAIKGYTEALKRDPPNPDEIRKKLTTLQK